MVKKAFLLGGILVTGAVALVSGQERPLPSILTQPAPISEPNRLSTELQQVQRQVVAAPQGAELPGRYPASAPAYPANGVRPVSMTQEPEVPAILSGRPPGASPQQLPSTTQTTPSAPRQLPTGPAAAPMTGPASSGTRTTPAPSNANPSIPSTGATPMGSPAGQLPSALPNSGASPMGAASASSETAPAGIAMVMRGPTLRVDVRGPNAISIGKPGTYEVLVSNPGQMEAAGVLVAIDFPAMVSVAGAQQSNGEIEQTDGTQAARVIWTVETVAAGGQQKLVLQLVPTQNTPFDIAAEWTVMPLTGSARVEVTQPALAMEVSGPDELQFGQTANFKFNVTNSGSGTAENVMVRLPEELGGDSKPLGDIPAGESRAFVLEVTPVEAGEMVISATALADGGLTKEASARFITRRANLDVAITGPEFKFAGTLATYDLVIRNTGDSMATGVIAAAALPEGAQYVDGVEGGEQVEGGVRWTIGQMAPNEQRTYAIRCVLNKAGTLQFEAGARGEGELAGAAAVQTAVEAVADVALQVEDPQGPKPVGEEVTYTLRITNRGSKQATDVRIVCQFSEGIEPTRVIGATADLAPGQALIRPIPRIDAGQEIVIEVKAKASKDDNLTFRAELTCENPETRRLFEATTRFFGSSRPNTTAVPSPRSSTPAASTSAPQSPSSFAPPATNSPSATPAAPSSNPPASLPPASAPGNSPAPSAPTNLQPPANTPLPTLNGGGSFRAGMLPRPGSGAPR